MRIKKYILLLAFPVLLGTLPVKSQNPMGLYFMETIPQSSQLNPAMQPRANGFFALPSVGMGIQSDIGFRDAFQEQSNGEWVTPLSRRFNYDDLYSTIGKTAGLNKNMTADVMGFGFRSGRDYFSLTVSVKNEMQMGIASDLFKITEEGFPDGQNFDFSSMRMKHAAYHELAFGYSREWNDYLTFGIRVKPLFGIMGGTSKIDQFHLSTSRTRWNMTVDGTLHTSAPLEVTEGAPGEFPESIEGRDLEDDEVSGYFTSLQNGGLAADFGVVYDYSDDWTFSAALSNLGYVGFKNDLNSLSFNGSYSFEGISVDGTSDEEFEQAFDDVVDSMETVIDYDVDHDKFSVPLSPSLYAGASYQWRPSVSFGLLSQSTFQKHNFNQAFNLSANFQPYSFLALNMNYSKRINGGNGLGSAVSLLLGPLQIFAAADYIPMRFADVTIDDGNAVSVPYRQKDLNLRFGLNFIFGRHGFRNEPMVSPEECRYSPY
ncbi:MAG: DUF5723 family protein [Marinilabilia sp.]